MYNYSPDIITCHATTAVKLPHDVLCKIQQVKFSVMGRLVKAVVCFQLLAGDLFLNKMYCLLLATTRNHFNAEWL